MKVSMVIRRLLVAVSVAAILMAPVAVAQKGKPTPTAVPLKVGLAGGYSISGDGREYVDAVDNVRAEFYYGDLYFDTNENKGDLGRRVNITFPTDCTVCPPSGGKDVYVATNPGPVPRDLALMQPGDTDDRPLAIHWAETDGYTYYLRHRGSDPRFGYVRFVCSQNLEGSIQWTASPLASVGLYRKPTRGTGSETYLGTLSMPFQMTLTK